MTTAGFAGFTCFIPRSPRNCHFAISRAGLERNPKTRETRNAGQYDG